MTHFKKLCFVVMFMSAVYGLPAGADEISDQIKEGLGLYEKGDYSEAISALNFAVGQIQQRQATGLKSVFPEPLAGWKAEESTGQFAAAPLLGGGVSVSRRYFVAEANKEVTIECVTDSPLLQSILMFYTNPAFYSSQPDTKLVKIQGRKALQKYVPQDQEGEINIVIGSRMLVSIKGRGLEKPDDMVTYANAIHYDVLEKYLTQ